MHGKIGQVSLFQKCYGFFIGCPFFDEVFSRFLSSSVKKHEKKNVLEFLQETLGKYI